LLSTKTGTGNRIEDRMNIAKTVATLLVLTLFLSALFGMLVIMPVEASSIVYVDAANFGDTGQDGSLSHPFDTIQEGVDAASSGDTVHVAPGVYREYVQIAKSSVSVVGEKGAVVDGDGIRTGIRVGALPPDYAENVSVSGFIVQNCVKGVVLVRCRFTRLRDVNMTGNAYNFADYSRQVNDIDVSNTVDGRPIYYWVGENGKQVPSDAGFVSLMNCTNIVVKNLNLTKNGQGIVLKYTSNSLIQSVNVSNNWDGVYIDAWNSNNTVVDCDVTNNLFMGIYISASWQNTVTNNRVSKNNYGMYLDESSSANIIVNNTISANENGLYFYGESSYVAGNVIRANTVSNNIVGFSLWFSRDNIIYHNNFVNNSDQASVSDGIDRWDYSGEGNYWSDYAGEDLDSDGVGETPYEINENNRDSFPLMGTFSFFSFPWREEDYYVSIVSNFSILEFRFAQLEKMISLDLTGPNAASGFCKVSFQIVLLGGPYTILVDDSPLINGIEISNGTHTFFYFMYEPGIRNVKIKGTTAIPEFSSFLMFFSAVFLVAVLLRVLGKSVAGKNSSHVR